MDRDPAFASGSRGGPDAVALCRSASPWSWLLARKEFWGRRCSTAWCPLPRVLPPVVTGYCCSSRSASAQGTESRLPADTFGSGFVWFRWTAGRLACG